MSKQLLGKKTNSPFNHFSPYSTSLTLCLTAFYSNGPCTFILGDMNHYSSPEMVLMGTPMPLGPPVLRVRSKLNTARGGCFRGLQPPRGKNEIKYSQRSLIILRTRIQSGIQEKNIYKIPNSAVFKIGKGNRKLYPVTLVTSNTNRNTHTHTHISFLFIRS